MRALLLGRFLILTFLISSPVLARTSAQEPENTAQPSAAPVPEAPASTAAPSKRSEQITVPVGTRLPLILRNGINTRTAKKGDSVYLETAYPIAVNNRIVIPMGSFIRGQILEAKRPGRIRGRGEFRILLEQMTFANGYTIELRATPSSVDREGREGVDSEGKIKGPSSTGRDIGLVLAGAGVGAYIGAPAGAIANDAPGRGALVGGGIGGLGALIAVLVTRGPEAELPRGTTMDVTFDRPLLLDAASLPANAGAGVDPQLRLAPTPINAKQNQRELQKKRVEQSMLRSILLTPF